MPRRRTEEDAALDGPKPVDPRIDRAIVAALHGRDLTGFEIWRLLEDEGAVAGLLAEPDLYPTLYRLEAAGLLDSDWQEGERIRRRYRLTATAVETARANGGPDALARGSGSTFGTPTPTAGRGISREPGSGTWFVPQVPYPAASSGEAASTSGEAAPVERRPRVDAVITAYVEDLEDSLDLPRRELVRVTQEIADHLHDSMAAVEKAGPDTPTAAAEAVAQLGSAPRLAARIGQAQHTSGRLRQGLRKGTFAGLLEVAMWLALAAGAIVISQTVADCLVFVALKVARLHLVVVRDGQWSTSQVAIALCIGAFTAGRMSLGQYARGSRRSDRSARRAWAIGGALAILVLVLILPGYPDAFTVAVALVAPFAFVAGTFFVKQITEPDYTIRGGLACVGLVAAMTFLPGIHTFAFDPNATPGIPHATGSSYQLTWTEFSDGSLEYHMPDSAGPFSVELWPAHRSGLFVVVDSSPAGPAVTLARPASPDGTPSGALPLLDPSKLAGHEVWWVVAVSNENGGPRVLDAEIQPGNDSSSPQSMLGWLLDRI